MADSGFTALTVTYELPPYGDAELTAMATMLGAWEVAKRDLDQSAKDRVVEWVTARLGRERRTHPAQVTVTPPPYGTGGPPRPNPSRSGRLPS